MALVRRILSPTTVFPGLPLVPGSNSIPIRQQLPPPTINSGRSLDDDAFEDFGYDPFTGSYTGSITSSNGNVITAERINAQRYMTSAFVGVTGGMGSSSGRSFTSSMPRAQQEAILDYNERLFFAKQAQFEAERKIRNTGFDGKPVVYRAPLTLQSTSNPETDAAIARLNKDRAGQTFWNDPVEVRPVYTSSVQVSPRYSLSAPLPSQSKKYSVGGGVSNVSSTYSLKSNLNTTSPKGFGNFLTSNTSKRYSL